MLSLDLTAWGMVTPLNMCAGLYYTLYTLHHKTGAQELYVRHHYIYTYVHTFVHFLTPNFSVHSRVLYSVGRCIKDSLRGTGTGIA